jgi:hypothetical protein
MGATPPKATRGLAAASDVTRREVASLGGKSVPKEKRAFFADPELAARAGRAKKPSRALPKPEKQVPVSSPYFSGPYVLRLHLADEVFYLVDDRASLNVSRIINLVKSVLTALKRPPAACRTEVLGRDGRCVLTLRSTRSSATPQSAVLDSQGAKDKSL